MRIRNVLLGLLAAACLANSAFAVLIPPRSLRQLFHDAELIVVARVQKKELGDRYDQWYLTKATLQISSVLKGGELKGPIAVQYDSTSYCPAPARYEKGKTILAFLRFSKKRNGYVTCSMSYGSKTLGREDMKIFVARIKELKEIQSVRDEDARSQRITDWLMRCANPPATRGDALLDLDKPMTPVVIDEKKDPNKEYWRRLRPKHMKRLMAILESAEPGEYGLPCDATRTMSILAKKTGYHELSAILNGYWRSDFTERQKIEAQKAVIAEYLSEYRRLTQRDIEIEKKQRKRSGPTKRNSASKNPVNESPASR